MHLKLKRISPLQAGKMLGALYGVLAVVFVPFLLVFMALGSFAARQQGGDSIPALHLMFGMGIGFVVLLPVIYAVMGFIGGAVAAWVYNMLAKWVGGFEFEFESRDLPVVPPPGS